MYGQPALGISLPWTAALRITPLAAAGATAAAGAAGQPPLLGPLPPLPAPLAGMLADLPHAAVIEIHSQIPIGLGFGSSAALCVAAERALAGVGAAPAAPAQPHDAPLASGAPPSPPAASRRLHPPTWRSPTTPRWHPARRRPPPPRARSSRSLHPSVLARHLSRYRRPPGRCGKAPTSARRYSMAGRPGRIPVSPHTREWVS